MSWHRDRGPGERRGYHHGNLREALIEAALTLISERGPPASPSPRRRGRPASRLRRPTGISATATPSSPTWPSAAFEAFSAALVKAWDGGKPSPRGGVRPGRRRLPRIRACRAGLLRGHVQIRAVARRLSGRARRGRQGIRRTAGCLSGAHRHAAGLGAQGSAGRRP